MQSVGLQTVLQMSNAAERMQSVAQQQGGLTAEQFKTLMDKQSDLKKVEVQQLEPKEDLPIRDEDRSRHENPQQHQETAKKRAVEENQKPESGMPIDPSQHGRLLNIKV
ncbi:MAG: hypothetical protein IEMM0002_0506 [bacterium]|nr:MAG: hypothetical protein IEMM0002_0506 [bacterium]